MLDILSKIKRMVLEPKIYALLVTSNRGQVIHLGVHFSLEEAYSAARQRMEMLTPHKPGEAMDIELWNMMPARQVIAQITDPMKISAIETPEGTPKTPTDNNVAPAQGAVVIEGYGKLPPILEALMNSANPEPEPVKQQNGEQPLVAPTLTDHIQDVKESRNDLMKKLIEDGDLSAVEKVKSLLGSHSRRYVIKAIEERKSTLIQTPDSKEKKN